MKALKEQLDWDLDALQCQREIVLSRKNKIELKAKNIIITDVADITNSDNITDAVETMSETNRNVSEVHLYAIIYRICEEIQSGHVVFQKYIVPKYAVHASVEDARVLPVVTMNMKSKFTHFRNLHLKILLLRSIHLVNETFLHMKRGVYKDYISTKVNITQSGD